MLATIYVVGCTENLTFMIYPTNTFEDDRYLNFLEFQMIYEIPISICFPYSDDDQ